MERRSIMSAQGFMLSRLGGAAVDAENRPMGLVAMVAIGSNSLLMSTLQYCSKKDIDV